MKKTKVLSLNEMANMSYKWAIISVDETENWREDIIAKAEKIEGVYLVNLRQPTHLCELVVSYPAVWIKNFIPSFENAEKFEEDELMEIELMENGDESFTYFHGSMKAKAEKFIRYGKEDDILENERCNPTVC